MVTAIFSDAELRQHAWNTAATVVDPEIPVLTIADLGVLRDVAVNGSCVEVAITPTYSGCPAMKVIEDDIRSALVSAGAASVDVETTYAPAWTTDWIGAEAKEKLRAFGIAPPGRAESSELVTLTRSSAPVACPYCGSSNTTSIVF